MGLVGRYGESVFTKGLLKFLDRGVVGCHCWCGHDRHFMRFDSKLASDAVELMDCDAHDEGCGVGSWSLRERVGKTNRIELTKM